MENINELWRKFNEYSNKLATALGRTSNIVGEYAEHLAHQFYGGRLLEISGASADIESGGKRYQVKSRKTKNGLTTQLNVIRSWDFEFLVVILFDERGGVARAVEVPVETARLFGKENTHQNGWVISTTNKFLNASDARDITADLEALNS